MEGEPSHLKPRCVHSSSWHMRWENFDKNEAPGDGQELGYPGGLCAYLGGGIFIHVYVCFTFHQLCTLSHHLSLNDFSLWVL